MDGRHAYRFPAAMRLKKRGDFNRVYRDGIAKRGKHFHLYFLPRGSGARLGIVIPRGWGSAVGRNRIRRLLREVFRMHQGVFSGADLIVVPQKGIEEYSAQEVRRELLKVFRSVNKEVRDG